MSLDRFPSDITPAWVRAFSAERFAQADAQLLALESASADSVSTAQALAEQFDDAIATMTDFELPYLLGATHADEHVRAAGREAEPEVDRRMTAIWLNPKIAAAVSSASPWFDALPPPHARLLRETKRDFRRGGLELSPEKQTRLRALNDEITRVGQEFSRAIDEGRDEVQVPEASLADLPEDYRARHPATNGHVAISTDYPDYFPFVIHSADRQTARALSTLFSNRGGQANVDRLEKLLELRQEKAHLLGYASWADFALEPKMAETSINVRAFLSKLSHAIRPKAEEEYAMLCEEHERLLGKVDGRLYPVDHLYLEEKARARRFALDARELTPYFPLNQVLDGIFGLAKTLYGVAFKEVSAPRWDEAVRTFDLMDGSRPIARAYLDLFPRPAKFGHAAMFGVRARHDRSSALPQAALVCNFAPPTPSTPSLLTHDEVVTLFHEFGHLLHHLLTQSPLTSFAGTRTVHDYVELPSQLFEEWAWRRESLDLFARHYRSGARLPDDIFAALIASRSFGRALGTLRQVTLSTLDLELHSRPSPLDSTALVRELQNDIGLFRYVEGTHFQGSFGHLVGYDAGYYGYQWALSLARDALTRFDREGYLNAAVAHDYRQAILAPGGSRDEARQLEDFLGRPHSPEAYIAFVTGTT